jgi:hypothetical protein
MCDTLFASHMHKPKQWVLTDETEKFRVHHYQAPADSESGLWIDLRWNLKRERYTAYRSNAIDNGEVWVSFERPLKNHAVAKRTSLERVAWLTVPQAELADV